MKNSVDPVTLEVVRNYLSSVAEEMSSVVMRSARSPLLREAGDLSSALTDANGDLIAQGRDIPMHIGVMGFTVKEFLKHTPKAGLAPGDVWFLNLPAIGGNHLPDVKAVRPIFVDDEIQGFAVSLAHWADIGGARPGSYVADAVDAWQEGLRMPPVRLFAREGEDREKLELVLANVRGAQERKGDILAQVSATRSADLRFTQLTEEYGSTVVQQAIQNLHMRAEQQMRDALSSIPDGDYDGEDFLDDDAAGGEPVGIRVDVQIRGDRAKFDFSRSDDATKGPVNTTPFIVSASVFYVMKALFGQGIQPNGGCFRPFEIVTRPGSVLDPPADKPVVGGNHETSQRVADAVFRAFEPIAADRLSAGGSTTSGLLLFAGSREDGQWVTLYETHGGGEGARRDRNGMPVVRVHMSNVMNTPAELIEAEYPIRVLCQRLREGSGGRGEYCGGDGLHREYQMRVDGIALSSMFERAVVPPYGLQGGENGAAFEVHVHAADGKRYELPGKANVMLNRGDVVVMKSSGGGGYGRQAD